MKRDTLGDSHHQRFASRSDDAAGEPFSIGVVDQNFSYGGEIFFHFNFLSHRLTKLKSDGCILPRCYLFSSNLILLLELLELVDRITRDILFHQYGSD